MMHYRNIGLTFEQELTIAQLLDQSPNNPPLLEDIWNLMDAVWNDMSLCAKITDPPFLYKYYSHPVWILNGLFIEQDDISLGHRKAICDWIISNKKELNLHTIIDYGSGFGTLPRLIAKKCKSIRIDIYEPYPNQFSYNQCKDYNNINFIDKVEPDYDCLMSLDVLEHVPAPLTIFETMIKSVRMDGYLILANNFYPVIKCHLPSTFHLRYSFIVFAYLMGLNYQGRCPNSHASIYQRKRRFPQGTSGIQFFETLSKTIFPILNYMHLKYRQFLR